MPTLLLEVSSRHPLVTITLPTGHQYPLKLSLDHDAHLCVAPSSSMINLSKPISCDLPAPEMIGLLHSEIPLLLLLDTYVSTGNTTHWWKDWCKKISVD